MTEWMPGATCPLCAMGGIKSRVRAVEWEAKHEFVRTRWGLERHCVGRHESLTCECEVGHEIQVSGYTQAKRADPHTVAWLYRDEIISA